MKIKDLIWDRYREFCMNNRGESPTIIIMHYELYAAYLREIAGEFYLYEQDRLYVFGMQIHRSPDLLTTETVIK